MPNTQALKMLEASLTAGTLPERDRSFASSLVNQAVSRGLSEKQWYWVEKLASALSPAKAEEAKAVADFSRVYAMFASAREHLKYPKVNLLADGYPVRLYVSGEHSRVPGVVNVTADGGDTWFGRVYPDGRWEQVRNNDPEATAKVEKMLYRFAQDPEKVASEHGKLTGNCCFCNRTLTDERSTDVGYGPVCASRFNLDWGSKKRK